MQHRLGLSHPAVHVDRQRRVDIRPSASQDRHQLIDAGALGIGQLPEHLLGSADEPTHSNDFVGRRRGVSPPPW